MKSAYFYFQRIKVTSGAKSSQWEKRKERTRFWEPKIMKPHKCSLLCKRCSEDLQRVAPRCAVAVGSPASVQARGHVLQGGWLWSADRRLADNSRHNRLLCMQSPATPTAFSHKGLRINPSLGMHPRHKCTANECHRLAIIPVLFAGGIQWSFNVFQCKAFKLSGFSPMFSTTTS